MNIRLRYLDLTCRLAIERIEFERFSYFFGEIGAGKSTIARLVDYCLGGELTMTPALQSEFVAVSLRLEVQGRRLSLSRERDSNQILANWGREDEDQQALIPARRAAGAVIPGSSVEVVSDLLFYLSDKPAPRVRRSAVRDDSELERLSLRDLFWYCYLDQDSIDSNFFNLDPGADQWRRLKSRNVLRYVLGIHQERVAELESELEEIRHQRTDKEGTAKALSDSLLEAGISSEAEIANRQTEVESSLRSAITGIDGARNAANGQTSHVVEDLRLRGQRLMVEIQAIESANGEVEQALALDIRHLNEITALSMKVHRIGGARAVLNGVEFVRCPRCAQSLPSRIMGDCSVCGQPEPTLENSSVDTETTKADISSRSAELTQIIDRQRLQLASLLRRVSQLRDDKGEIDRRLNEAAANYDSAYLATALDLERERASLEQELRYLHRIRVLPGKVRELTEAAAILLTRETVLREELRSARELAEGDLRSVSRLKELFLDCLLRSRLPGFSSDDEVRFGPPWFLPEVLSPETGDVAVTSFETQGSGGKKTLFKCCFALALHRLSAEIDGPLPSLLMIDSPMKNISERENRAQFEGFHQLLYELAEEELVDTQFVLIDKEFCPPPVSSTVEVRSRHMRVDNELEPPLIPYYRDRRSIDAAQDIGADEATDLPREDPEEESEE